MASPASIAVDALRRLGVIAAGETAAEADLAYAEAQARLAHRHFFDLGLTSWGEDAVPAELSHAYEVATASFIAPAFGKSSDAEGVAEQAEVVRQYWLGTLSGTSYAEGRTEALRARDNLAGSIYGGAAQAMAEDKIRSAHAMAAGLGLAEYSIEATPRSVAEAYIAWAAAALAPTYGKALDVPDLQATAKRLLLGRGVGLAWAEEAVQAVHSDLAARRRARWVLADVPTYAAEPLVMMAAARFGQRAQMPYDPAEAAEGERMILRAHMVPDDGRPARLVMF